MYCAYGNMLCLSTVGLGKSENKPRDTGFDISVASEIMAVLALTTSLGIYAVL